MVELAATIFSDGPSSNPDQPMKPRIRDWGTWIESVINAFVSGAGTIFVSKASMDANLNYPQFTMAWVLGDATVANNGVYRKIGTSGTGNWVRTGDLPYSFIIASDVGAGTPNAIQATTSIPVSASALIWMNIADTNTSSPVTVSFNGGSTLTIKTNSGNDVATGGLVAGMIALGIVSGSAFRLVSDQSSEAILAAAEAAQEAAEAAAASINQRIYTTRQNAIDDTILAVVKRLRTQFYAPNFVVPATLVGGANYRRVSLLDLAGYPSASYFRSSDRFMPDGSTDATNGGYWVIDELEPTVTMFGSIGDGTTADEAAIQAALTWWGLADNRTLIFDEGKRFLLNSGVSINCDGRASPGSIIMRGSVRSAANIAALFTFTNVRGGRFGLKVFGGGQTANYVQANPAGMNEAFRFVNAYGAVIEYVEGQEYAGRVLRITSDTPGSGGFRSQWLEIKRIYVNSSAALTASEPTRLSQGVGQAFFIDSGLNAFGKISDVICLWDLYGPVIEDTTDVTLEDLESLWRGNSGMEIRGVIGFWGGHLKLGSELTTGTMTLLKITDSASRNSQQINIGAMSCVGGYNGLEATNVGVTSGPGLQIGAIYTRNSRNRGITLDNCRKFNIQQAMCYADVVCLEMTGACSQGEVDINTIQSKAQAIIVGASVAGQIKFTGSARDGNADLGSNISLIDINTTASILFDTFIASSGNVDFLYDVVAAGSTRIMGGQVVTSGGTAIINNQPSRVEDVIGWATENRGTATILSGGTSIVVNHGLVKAPDYVLLTGRASSTSACFVTNITSTQFTINVPSAVPSNQAVNWRAWADYAG